MLLQSSWSVWVLHRYDPVKGRASPRLTFRPGPSVAGRGAHVRTVERGRIFVAVYVLDGALRFALGPDSWNLDAEPIDVAHRSTGGYCFFSIRSPRLARSCSYRDPSSFWSRIDPTYDGIDRDHDDFLMDLSRFMPNPEWRASMRAIWAGDGRPAALR